MCKQKVKKGKVDAYPEDSGCQNQLYAGKSVESEATMV